MSRRKKRVVTTQEFMERARKAIEAEEVVCNTMFALLEELEKILSDGQQQQLSRFMDELEERMK